MEAAPLLKHHIAYLRTSLKVFVTVFVGFDTEVTTTVTVPTWLKGMLVMVTGVSNVVEGCV
jgi:hypothetical protein